MNTEKRIAIQGEAAKCQLCHKSIALHGDSWLDLDGTRRCVRGNVHTPNGRSPLPDRLYMTKDEGK